MPEERQESNQVAIILVLILAVCLLIATAIGGFMYYRRQEMAREDWKRRWNDDTTQLATDLKAAQMKIDDGANKIKEAEEKIRQQELELQKINSGSAK